MTSVVDVPGGGSAAAARGTNTLGVAGGQGDVAPAPGAGGAPGDRVLEATGGDATAARGAAAPRGANTVEMAGEDGGRAPTPGDRVPRPFERASEAEMGHAHERGLPTQEQEASAVLGDAESGETASGTEAADAPGINTASESADDRVPAHTTQVRVHP